MHALARLTQGSVFSLALFLSGSVALAQSGAPVAQPGPASGELVPSWVFYWLLGLSSAIGTALLGTIGVLWRHATTERDVAVKAASDAVNLDLADLRRQVSDWRSAFEASEKGRREDMERHRIEDREQLKLSITTLTDITDALRDNTREIKSLMTGQES